MYHWRFFLGFSFPSEHWQALLHWVKCCRNRKAYVDKCVEGMNIDYKLLWHYISYHFRYVTGLSWLCIWQKADHYNAMPNRPNLLICCYTSWLLKSFPCSSMNSCIKISFGYVSVLLFLSCQLSYWICCIKLMRTLFGRFR